MFGFGKKKDEAKVVLKTKKGRGPIRKVKVAIGVGVVSAALRPLLEPWFQNWLGHVPDGLIEQIAETVLSSYEVIATITAAYLTRPAEGDQPVPVEDPA